MGNLLRGPPAAVATDTYGSAAGSGAEEGARGGAELAPARLPPRVDLRVDACAPYFAVENQGDTVACVAHAFSTALYCTLRSAMTADAESADEAGALVALRYPATSRIYSAALLESHDEKRGVSFDSVRRILEETHAAEFAALGLAFKQLGNSSDALRAHLAKGHPVVTGYQVNRAIDNFHKSAQACAEHGYVLPRFASDPRPVSGHTVLLVGYDDSFESFIARNSWGHKWGHDGHFLIRYGDIEDDEFFTDILALSREETRPRPARREDERGGNGVASPLLAKGRASDDMTAYDAPLGVGMSAGRVGPT
jgi:hypothetical protein